MLDKIEELERRFQELEALLSDPAIINNQPEFRKLSREHSDLSPLVAVYRRYRKVIEQIVPVWSPTPLRETGCFRVRCWTSIGGQGLEGGRGILDFEF